MLDSGLYRDRANPIASSICMQYTNLIRRIIRSRLKDEYQVDDVFQNVCLHLLVNPMPTDIEHIERHLYKTAVNCIASNKRQTACVQSHLNRYVENVGVVIEAQEDPRDVLINAEETTKMFTLIRKQLSGKEFRAISLCYMNNFDIREVASTMGVKAKSVRQYLRRGRKKLRSPLILKEIFAISGYGRRPDYPNRSAASLASA